MGIVPELRILKISVLATDALLLDGQPVTLRELEQTIKEGAAAKLTVWYYRENSAGEPSAFAAEVLRLITEHRLPIRLSSRPDFSDTVTDIQQTLKRVFESVREKAAHRQLVILRPDGRQVVLPALENGPPEATAAVEKMLPSNVKRNVAVMGETAWTMGESLNLQTANQAIPFFGLLMGFASIGHSVWIFNTKAPGFLAAACRDADVLIVDGPLCPGLPSGWQASAQKAMRNKQILVHDRETHQLRKA
jgi:hypothetical protein